ncbi:hypothetical protein TRAPUB_6307 [Trametes pubescens]|uniref:Uncharacterized protein n=1 Tax=Trametes pubescens TaxID=154538 RepID=A0A1M2V688_TRAPU|nr:hypothetical protein TRAPUB_6307 [Trametes pubescens]
MASSVFEDMVVVAQPDTGDNREPPVIPLTEDSDTLDALLRLCYPIEKPDRARSLEDIPPLLAAALKYLMPLPISVLKNEILSSVRARPLQVWAIGCRLGLEDIARAGGEAALHFKNLGTYNYLREFVPVKDFLRDARGVSAGDYFRLVEFHRRGGAVPPEFLLTRPAVESADHSTVGISSTTLVANDFFASLAFPDIICRASDGSEYPAHKGLLCMVSPAIHDKIIAATSAPPTEHSPSGADTKNLPIIDFTEDGGVLATLLRLCYPGHPLYPDDMPLLLATLEAAETYKMTGVSESLRLHRASMITQVPLSAYFVAVQAGLHQEARVAARHSLRMSLCDAYVPEMEHATPQAYQRLVEYHDRAREAAAAVARAFDVWQGSPIPDSSGATGSIAVEERKKRNRSAKKGSFHPNEERCNGGCQGFQGQSWFEERRQSYLKHLAERPGEVFLSDLLLFRSSATYNLGGKPWCACCFRLATGIVRLGMSLPEKIAGVLDKIEL